MSLFDAELQMPLRPLRLQEYDLLIEMGAFQSERVELIDGRLVQMSPQGERHVRAVSALMRIFNRALGDRAEVRGQAPFTASNESVPEPDVALVAPGPYTTEHPSTAMLIVEASDATLRLDRVRKGPLYAASKVAEYWIVNLVDECVEIHRDPANGRYRSVETHGRGAVIHPLAFPDVAVPVDELLPPV